MSVTTTQDMARSLPIGYVAVADEQTLGRGRLDRAWVAPPGTALLASFVVAPNPVASLAAGVAAAEACGPSIRLKWPNDLLLDGAKLGGILVESLRDRMVVGIGINLTSAPEGAAMLGEDRDALLLRLVRTLDHWMEATPEAVIVRWRELTDTLGRQVRVEYPNESFEGVAEDIAADGSLIVSGRVVSAGDVVHLR